jgi:2-dehydro-3-deoxygalactonokinase
LIGLPGSHSKWVEVVAGRITHFDTFMTGELFAVLSTHSILGRTQKIAGQFQADAFDRGVRVALSEDGRARCAVDPVQRAHPGVDRRTDS